MISFIIIGRNESWKLTKCIQSVLNAAHSNHINNYEIIYVDSNSTDDSVKRVKQFSNVKAFILTSDYNAAIARNVGVKKSKGDVLFFIDGDMEIIPTFLPLVYNEKDGLLIDYISGNWINYYYDHNNKLIKKEKFENKDTDSKETVTGGLFLINKNTWDLVGGMNDKFKKSQDTDLGLRLANKGIFLLRKMNMAAIHHTIAYLDKKRMWQDFLNWNHLYGRSFLYRTHIFNKHVYKRMFRNDYTLLLLIICIVASIFLKKFAFIVFLLYAMTVAFRAKFKVRNSLYFFLRDLSVLIGIFIFFPKKKEVSFEKIK